MFYVGKHDRYSQYVIKRRGAGVLPVELSGIYTTPVDADEAIKTHKRKFEEGLAEAAEKELKQKELDKKPLSDTQRKRRNAKKPSTSRE